MNAQGKAKKAANLGSNPNSIPNSPKSLNSASSQNLRFQTTFAHSLFKEDALGGSSPKSSTMTTSNLSLHPVQQNSFRTQVPQSAFFDRRNTTAEPKTVWLSVPQPKRNRLSGNSAGEL